MKRRGPTPSLLAPPAPPADEIGHDEVRVIMRTTCWKKRAYSSLHMANTVVAHAASLGDQVTAYQCPFHTLHEHRHWHVGHPPNHYRVTRMALAIRWCAQHHDELPTPPPR